MRKIILDYVKSLGTGVLLRNKMVPGCLDLIAIDFIGKDSLFYSFLAAYNETEVFSFSKKRIGLVGGSCRLENCLLVMDSKKEWAKKKWDLTKAINTLKYLEMLRDNSIHFAVCVGRFRLMQYQFYTKPFVGFSLVYSKNDNYEGTIVVNSYGVIYPYRYLGDEAVEFAEFILELEREFHYEFE